MAPHHLKLSAVLALVSISTVGVFFWKYQDSKLPPALAKPILTLQGHEGVVYSVAISPDGKFLASASNDQSIKLWNAKTGKELFNLLGKTGHVFCVAFSPDGN